MYPCPICRAPFEKRKEVDLHLTQEHAENKNPYPCTQCPAVFASEKASKLHRKNHHSSAPVTALAGSQPKRARLADCPYVGTFSDWVLTRYNTTCDTHVEELAPATIVRIVAFAAAVRFDENHTLDQVIHWADEGRIIDAIDTWMDDELERYEMQTVNNHLRYLKLLVLFRQAHLDPPEVHDAVVEYLVDLVVDTQSSVTRATTTLNMLKLEDPFALAYLRDRVVNTLLREQVEYINPYISHLRDVDRGSSTHIAFGLRLRNWLELAMRFTNIPCRIQCSRELQMPEQDGRDYVAKLVLREGQYCRLINQDKTAASHQPLLLPLGRSLSAYLYLYITYCRTADHPYVFETRRGKKWRRPSRDLKQYLQNTLDIPVHDLDPTGRFIHGSRSIMMATFAIGAQFDQQKMHGFARLMRHSSTTNERFYSMWQQRALANQSIDVFASLMHLDFRSHTQAPVSYVPVQLRDAPTSLLALCAHGLGSDMADTNVAPCYSTRSVGTQTGLDESAQEVTDMREIDVADTVPACETCGLFSLVLHGPFGSTRRKKYFGRYYLACSTCHLGGDGRFSLPKCIWFPLGYRPIQASKSNRPRNLKEIRSFLASS